MKLHSITLVVVSFLFSINLFAVDCDGVTCGEKGSAYFDRALIQALSALDVELDGPTTPSDPRAQNPQKSEEKTNFSDHQDQNQNPGMGGGGGGSGDSSGNETGMTAHSEQPNVATESSIGSFASKNDGNLEEVDFSNAASPMAHHVVEEPVDTAAVDPDKKQKSRGLIGGLFYSGGPGGQLPTSSGKSNPGEAAVKKASQDKGSEESGFHSVGGGGGGSLAGAMGEPYNADRNKRLALKGRPSTSAEELLRRKMKLMGGSYRGIASSKQSSIFQVICHNYSLYAKKNHIKSGQTLCPTQ